MDWDELDSIGCLVIITILVLLWSFIYWVLNNA